MAKEEGLQFYAQVDDCIATIAAEFGGGRQTAADLSIIDLLRWTNRAIERQQQRIELAQAMRGI